jgi:hypothetical protein
MKLKIESNGPRPQDVKIIDAETGKPLEDMGIFVHKITIEAGKLHEALLEVSLNSLHMVCTGRMKGNKIRAMAILKQIAETGEAKL